MFISSVDFSLFPTNLATNPDISAKQPDGWPNVKESSPITSNTYFLNNQGIIDQ